jgi:hypothetical protein
MVSGASRVFGSRAITQSDPDNPENSGDTRDVILIRSARLKDYFDRARIPTPKTSEHIGVFANSSVAGPIRSWVTTTESQILYTDGMDLFGEGRHTPMRPVNTPVSRKRISLCVPTLVHLRVKNHPEDAHERPWDLLPWCTV